VADIKEDWALEMLKSIKETDKMTDQKAEIY
jgi:hypothetical protein